VQQQRKTAEFHKQSRSRFSEQFKKVEGPAVWLNRTFRTMVDPQSFLKERS
jgi:hypothetical protein